MTEHSASHVADTTSQVAFWVALLALTVAAVYLRVTSITWGAPFVYHPDEHLVVHPALDIVRTSDLNPRWFQMPSLLIYVQALLTQVVQTFVHAPLESNYLVNGIGPSDVLPSQWPFVLAGRMAVALSGVAGVILLSLCGARLFSAPVGLAAAGFLLASPLHNEGAHCLTTDVPAATLLIASLYAATSATQRFLLAGLLAGLAAGTKYGAAVAVLAPAILALDTSHPSETVSRWSRLAIGAMLGFLISTPFALLDAPVFWEGAQAQHPIHLSATAMGSDWRGYIGYLYRTGMGPLPTLLAALGVVRAGGDLLAGARRAAHFRQSTALLVPALLYVTWLCMFPSLVEHNLILVLPFVCLLGARVLERVAMVLRPGWLGHVVFGGLALVAVLTSTQLVLDQNERLARPDTRTNALHWIEANLPPHTKLAREEFTPQVQGEQYDVSYVASLARRPYSWYESSGIQYLVTSSNASAQSLGAPHIGGEAAQGFYKALFQLPLAAEFKPGPEVNGPTIRIYKVGRVMPVG